jgi:hypothetical protein
MSDNIFHRTALKNRAVWSGAVLWLHCCLYSGSWQHPHTGKWLLRKAVVGWVSEMTLLAHNCFRMAPLVWLNWDPPERDLQFLPRAAPQRWHVLRIYFQANLELHPYVEKWAGSQRNHWQLKMSWQQLDLWHRLKWIALLNQLADNGLLKINAQSKRQVG